MTPPAIDQSAVREVLAAFQDPETGRRVTETGQIHALELADGRLSVTVGLTGFAAPIRDQLHDELSRLLKGRFAQLEVHVHFAPHARPPEQLGTLGLTARAVVAVGSGKGGVGKSSLAVYLAYGLQRAGCEVGLLDADLYGPSIPHLLGSQERPVLVDERIQPIAVGGVKVMSIGLLVPGNEAVIWRGPMLHSALQQFLRDTAWGELDYLVVDLPPGTGDVALSLSQLLPLTGAVVVCTPQDVALLDATKAITMFRRVSLDVLGMVENMSYFICPDCGSRHEIFGSGGARRRAEQLGVPFLGQVPLDPRLRIQADEGRTTEALEEPSTRDCLEAISRNLVATLAARRRQEPRNPTLPVLDS